MTVLRISKIYRTVWTVLEMVKVVDDVYEMMYVNVTLIYTYNLTMEQSRSTQDIRRAIMQEIKERTQAFTKVLILPIPSRNPTALFIIANTIINQ